jgi:hypothetical protein
MSHTRRSSISSLDSPGSSDGYFSEDDEYALARKEYEENVEQLKMLVSVVLMPFLGKFLGRRWSHWLFARYQILGLGKAFWRGEGTIFAGIFAKAVPVVYE